MGFRVRLRLIRRPGDPAAWCARHPRRADVCTNLAWAKDFADPQSLGRRRPRRRPPGGGHPVPVDDSLLLRSPDVAGAASRYFSDRDLSWTGLAG